jgi:hypothetical protein
MSEQEQKAFAREYLDAVNAVEATQDILFTQREKLATIHESFAKLCMRDQHQVDCEVQVLKGKK